MSNEIKFVTMMDIAQITGQAGSLQRVAWRSQLSDSSFSLFFRIAYTSLRTKVLLKCFVE